MATVEQLATALKSADAAGDVEAATKLAAAIKHMRTNGQQNYIAPPPQQSFLGRMRESITGEQRRTPETEAAPEWTTMPELNDLKSKAGWATGLGTLMSGTPEAVKVIQANYPDVKVRQDERGNYFLTSGKDGREYAVKPGFRLSDLPRAGAAVAAFTPAGRAPGLLAQGFGAGATQAVIEGTQAATGGEFNPEEVAAAAVLGAAVPAGVNAAKAAAKPAVAAARQVVDRVRGRPAATPVTVPRAGPVVEAPVAPPERLTSVHPESITPARVHMKPEVYVTRNGDVEVNDMLRSNIDADGMSPYAGGTVTETGDIRILDAGVPEKLRGQGAAAHMYEQVIAEADKRGVSTVSRADVSPEEARVWEALERRGYEVHKNPDITVREDGYVISNEPQAPVFTIGPKSQAGTKAPEAVSAAQAPAAQAQAQVAQMPAVRPPDTLIEAPDVKPVATQAPVAELPLEDLAKTAKTASDGGWSAKNARQVLAEQASPNPKTVEAAKRLGIEEHLQPDHVTTNQSFRELSQAVKSVPGSAAKSQEVQNLEKVAERADKLVEEIGGTNDLSRLDVGLRDRMGAAQAELEHHADSLYKRLRDAVPQSTPAPASGTVAWVAQRAKDLGDAKNLSSLEKMVLAKLSPKQASGKAGKGAVTQPTYALLDDVRKEIGSATQGKGAFKDADSGLAKKLYNLLSDDQGAVLDGLGHKEMHDLAKAAVRTRKSLEDDMTALYGRHLDGTIVGKLDTAVKNLAKGDVSNFVKLLRATPEDMRQRLVASGLNSAFQRNLRSGQLSFTSYTSWYEGLLRNKQAYTALMSNLPRGARKQLSDLYRVSKGISKAQKEFIATGRINVVRDIIRDADTFAAKIYEVAKKARAGAAAEAVTTSIGLPGAGVAAGIASALSKSKTPALKAADELLASQEFADAVKQIAVAADKMQKAGDSMVTASGVYANPGVRTSVKRLAASSAVGKFMHAIGKPRDLSTRERWVLATLQADNNLNEDDK